MASRPYPFVDWMKALGMSVIVYGHVAHATTVPLTPPIYLKQFGVAFFLFATGFTLARETRSAGETVFNRLFQVYLFGLSLAFLLTVLSVAAGGRGAPSNYLPFAGGLNVIVNNFPANPTTWYLGTYLHLLVIWAVWLRRIRIRTWMVIAALAIEIPIRALVVATAGPYVAYMVSTNWAAVFLLGLARGGAAEEEVRRNRSGICRGARRQSCGVGCCDAVPAVRADVPLHVADRLAAGQRTPVRVRQRVASLRRHHRAAVRSDSPHRGGAGAGCDHRSKFTDCFSAPHAHLLPAASAAGHVDLELLDKSRDPAARLSAWPGTGVRGGCRGSPPRIPESAGIRMDHYAQPIRGTDRRSGCATRHAPMKAR